MTVTTLQVDSELARLTELCRKLEPERLLEIGCYQGGTLKVWLENCHPAATVVAVDTAHVYPKLYSQWKKPYTSIVRLDGSSQESAIKQRIEALAPYDFVFIDGDHGYSMVSLDVSFCLPLVREGGILAMHDIVSESGGQYGPGMVLDELEGNGHDVERVIAEELGDYVGAHGIGIVHL